MILQPEITITAELLQYTHMTRKYILYNTAKVKSINHVTNGCHVSVLKMLHTEYTVFIMFLTSKRAHSHHETGKKMSLLTHLQMSDISCTVKSGLQYALMYDMPGYF